MKREPALLADETYDILVIGGGVHGLAIAWDAALRGFSTALVEQNDFGAGPSAHSYKLVHGGLRYLQHLDFRRMRMSIFERWWLQHAARHMIEPLSFLVPCYGHGIRGPAAMRAALLINDFMGRRRYEDLAQEDHLAPGKVISAAACRAHVPWIKQEGLTGGGIFTDAQMLHSERLTLLFAKAAAAAGVKLANYCRAEQGSIQGQLVNSVAIRDTLSGESFSVQADWIVDATGIWSQQTLDRLHGQPPKRVPLSKGIQLFTRPVTAERMAFAFESHQVDSDAVLSRGARNYFMTPWRSLSFFGTTDTVFEGNPDRFHIREEEAHSFFHEICAALPGLDLTEQDIIGWNGGLRPLGATPTSSQQASTARHADITDGTSAGLSNLVSVVGNKYTTCRAIAEQAVDLLCAKANRSRPCKTREQRLPGGDIESTTLAVKELTAHQSLPAMTAERLIRLYGSEAVPVAACLSQTEHPSPSPNTLTSAEVVYAVENEMALQLGDVIFRRSDICQDGTPDEDTVKKTASLMAHLLNWPNSMKADQVHAVEQQLQDAGRR